MQEAPIPADDAERLASLYALHILDTPPEERFDRVTRLAQHVFTVPITYIALVDADRQWFKSKIGLEADQTPRAISFCGHAILGDRPLVVPDAGRDERFHDNPLVLGDPHVRFYAGHPLAGPEGRKVGTLCLVDREPRSLTPDELALLEDLARVVEGEFELVEVARLQQQLVEAKRRAEQLARDLEVRNTFIRRTFGRYLSDEVVASLLETPAGLDLGGQTRRVTIMMADLRGFSTLAERLAPDRVVALLNNFLGTMAECVNAHGGTVDEFVGDAILALFGAPLAHPDHARRAIACAVGMQQAMPGVNRFNREHGLPEIEMGIGLETGEVVVGNIGSEQRSKFGVVGTAVNMAARIESYTVGGQILASESTLRDAGEGVQVGSAMTLHPKGARGPLVAHPVLGIDEEALEPEHDVLLRLDAPLPVLYDVVRDKHSEGPQIAGEFLALSERRALLRGRAPVETLDSLRISLADAEALYARVLEVDGPSCLVRFTAVPPEARRVLERTRPNG